jgi:mRNA interferase YafQ
MPMKNNTVYEIKETARFRKDYRLAKKRGENLSLLREIVIQLANGEKLPDKNRDHALTNDWAGFRECHITPDWLLVYQWEDDVLVLTLTRTGSHSDLDF